VARIVANPAPGILLDTCTLLDLFRRDPTHKKPRVPPEEIQAVHELLRSVTTQTKAIHLIVPELVPGEYADHANKIEQEFDSWLSFLDDNQVWLADAALLVGVALAGPSLVQPLGFGAKFRKLADDLLALAGVLSRDQVCLDRAVSRLITKRRPSHKKEIKDSMNLEQCLELSSLLSQAQFTLPRVFVSSNTNDFAESQNFRVHSDLQADFAACGLEYFPSLRETVGSLRNRGPIP
jgi:hypothetical protein